MLSIGVLACESIPPTYIVDAVTDLNAPPADVTIDDGRSPRDAALDAPSRACEVGQRRCVDDSRISDCADDGTWAPPTRWCIDATCADAEGGRAACVRPCEPGSRACDGGVLLECDVRGEAFGRVAECRFECAAGACVEGCTGVDDDGDGQTDEGFAVGDQCAVGTGACTRNATLRCRPDGRGVECPAEPGPANDERCNLLDDDCDGVVDETFDLRGDRANCGACGVECTIVNGLSLCNEGQCRFVECVEDWSDCNDDLETDGCETRGPCGDDADCDGRDNDADGLLDEAFVPIECGVGACVAQSACVDGLLQPCEPGAAAVDDAQCDGVDDDCDGEVDEGYTPEQCGVGACRAQTTCVDGVEAACVAGLPGLEACNQLDDDCDGSTDEDFDLLQDHENCGACGRICAFPNAVPLCDQGECGVVECRLGWADCNNSVEIDGCETPDACGPDRCDGEDQDGDGRVDEDFVPAVCGLGACVSTSACVDGEERPCQAAPAAPLDQQCDGIDEDCDGTVDEDYEAVSCGVGTCLRTSACVEGAERPCEPGPAGESDGRCDGLDEDCDGAVDEAYEVVECGLGVCAAVSACADGVERRCQPLEALEPLDLACDGLDVDCDGAIDEDYLPAGCGVGVCAMTATLSACVDGVERPCVPGDAIDADMQCDALDTDCDGAVDEGVPNDIPCSVGVGACERSDVLVCRGGDLTCPAEAAAPGVELCSGADDDCDGLIDEGFAVGEACQSGLGVCRREGVVACGPDGAARCSAELVEPEVEACNGLDDDCDGVVDETADLICSEGPALCPRQGQVACVDDVATCALQPEPEGCRSIDFDGIDDYVQAPAEPRFELTEFTLEALVRLDWINPVDQMTIVAHGENGGGDGPLTDKIQYDLRVGPNGTLQIAYEKTDEPLQDQVQSLRSQQIMEPGRWYRVAASRDAAGRLRIYVDGELDATSAPLPPGPLTIDHPVTIGARWNSGRAVESYLRGQIDDVKIWRRALTDLEISECWSETPAPGADDLVAWFKATDAPEAGMHELVSGAFHATLGGARFVADVTPDDCNGLDDDCDGRIDEDFAPEGCGIGACAAGAVPSACVDGAVVPCLPAEPVAEICDEQDNDCDGLTDEVPWLAHPIGLGERPIRGLDLAWRDGYGVAVSRDGTGAVVQLLDRAGDPVGNSRVVVPAASGYRVHIDAGPDGWFFASRAGDRGEVHRLAANGAALGAPQVLPFGARTCAIGDLRYVEPHLAVAHRGCDPLVTVFDDQLVRQGNTAIAPVGGDGVPLLAWSGDDFGVMGGDRVGELRQAVFRRFDPAVGQAAPVLVTAHGVQPESMVWSGERFVVVASRVDADELTWFIVDEAADDPVVPIPLGPAVGDTGRLAMAGGRVAAAWAEPRADGGGTVRFSFIPPTTPPIEIATGPLPVTHVSLVGSADGWAVIWATTEHRSWFARPEPACPPERVIE